MAPQRRAQRAGLGGDVDLEDPQEEGGVVRVRGMYLESDEIRRHIESGKQVVDWRYRGKTKSIL